MGGGNELCFRTEAEFRPLLEYDFAGTDHAVLAFGEALRERICEDPEIWGCEDVEEPMGEGEGRG